MMANLDTANAVSNLAPNHISGEFSFEFDLPLPGDPPPQGSRYAVSANAVKAARIASTLDDDTRAPHTSEADVTPSSIRANWYALRSVPEEVYGDMYYQASVFEKKHPASTKVTALTRSIKGFIQFWRGIEAVAEIPLVTVSPSGNVIAEWFHDDEHSLGIMINPNGVIYYSLFDNAQPCEGYCETETCTREMVKMFCGRENNPFHWTET